MNRGDVVIVDFPFTSGTASKLRPALIVQNDREIRRITKTIVSMITGNLRRANEDTHCLVDPGTSDGASSGLNGPSLVSCINLTRSTSQTSPKPSARCHRQICKKLTVV